MAKKFIIVEQSATSLGGHYFVYTSCVARAAQKAGYDVTILCNERLSVSSLGTPFSVIPCFTHTWGEAEARGFVPFGPGHFAFELDGGLHRLDAGPEDLVFIHTCGYAELRGLLEYFVCLPPQQTHPQFHILLRYDPEYLVDNLSHYFDLFDFIKKSKCLRDIVHFHSDTEALAREFEALSKTRFGVCPIPFDQSFLFLKVEQKHLAKSPSFPNISFLAACSRWIEASRKTPKPLTIAYLGDARPEKGYQHFPDAVEYLWRDYLVTGRAHFVLQSNFNVPGGEPGMLAAMQKLGQFGDCVSLLTEPLSPDEYYSILAGSDVVVMPYSAERYRIRSSGVLVEAMTAGKVVVTTRDSWMDSQVSPEHAVVYARSADLGPAIAEAVDRFDDLKRGAEARQPAARAQSDPAALIAYLIGQTPIDERKGASAPLALFVTDGGSFVLSNGASKVAETQLKYLDAAGYRVAALFVNHNLEAPNDEWKRGLIARMHSYRLERIFIAGPGKYHLSQFRDMRLSNCGEFGDYSIANDVERIRAYDFSGDLVSYLRRNAPDVVLLNYITSLPVLEALGLAGTPVICEIHDIQSLQKAIYRRSPISKADLDLEFQLLKKCDYLISLNERETHYIQDRLPDRPIATIGALIDIAPPELDLLAGATDCAEIVASAGPKRPDLQFARLGERLSEDCRKLVEFGNSLDLLFVSSAHMANVSGLNWFFEEVYERFLADYDINMIVAGSIDTLGPFSRCFKRIAFVGQVLDLDPLYAATKIVILPITEGAGSAIKTCEALSKCKPLVPTSVAMRGIDATRSGITTYDDAESFAKAILWLLESPEERLRAAKNSFEAATKLNSFAAYSHCMNDILRSVIGEKARSAPVIDEAPVFQATLVEWSEELRAANRAVRDCLEGRPLNTLWSLALPTNETRSFVERSAAALMDRRTAPLLRNSQSIFETVSRTTRFMRFDDIGAIVDIAGSSDEGRPAEHCSIAVLINSRFNGHIVGHANDGSPSPQTAVPTSSIRLERDSTSAVGRPAWNFFCDDKRLRAEFALLRLPDTTGWDDWVVHQDIPISPHVCVLGRHVFHKWNFETRDGMSFAAKVFDIDEPRPFEKKQTFVSRAWNAAIRKFRASKMRDLLFDADWYLMEYTDVRQAGADPFKHYKRHGAREGRNPNPFFDTNWYLREHPDAAGNELDPLDHYIEIGARLGLDPSPRFSTTGYLDENPDVREARLNPLAHFLHHGRHEGRDPRPTSFGYPPQTLFLPAVTGEYGHSWVELELVAENGAGVGFALDILLEGEKLSFALEARGSTFIARAPLSFRTARNFGLLHLSIFGKSKNVSRTAALTLTAVRVGWDSAPIEQKRPSTFVSPDRSAATVVDRSTTAARRTFLGDKI